MLLFKEKRFIRDMERFTSVKMMHEEREEGKGRLKLIHNNRECECVHKSGPSFQGRSASTPQHSATEGVPYINCNYALFFSTTVPFYDYTCHYMLADIDLLQ
jgi:hypothetical protein